MRYVGCKAGRCWAYDQVSIHETVDVFNGVFLIEILFYSFTSFCCLIHFAFESSLRCCLAGWGCCVTVKGNE